ncbi:MAG: ABC transporter ATP-binding protein [Anaerolineaceae bacterium]|nr:ABC transporter ATP-binding protein [Anaerolineaceae bacterium]
MSKLLEVKGLKTGFYLEKGMLPAVDGLDFSLDAGETLAIVGESGCGKTVTALSILQLIPKNVGKIMQGSIMHAGKDLAKQTEKEMRSIRGNEISMIFQEPMTSLNPVFTIGKQVSRPLMIHQGMSRQEAEAKAVEMLDLVGIPEPDRVIQEYPHQLSGGMRQRVMIAIALACKPQILIADEPTTALDVTIQAQILKLLAELKEKTGTAIVLITHDMGVVAQIADNVLVMYAGEAVEYQAVKRLFAKPHHPYTSGLLQSIPSLVEDKEALFNIPGNVPSPAEMLHGCKFAPRCQYADANCRQHHPDLRIMKDGAKVRCHYPLGVEANEER